MNDAALVLINAYGGRNQLIPLGTLNAGNTRGYEGLEINAVGTTTFGMGINPQTGNAAVGFSGEVFFSGTGLPTKALFVTFEKGALDLGTGGFFAEGHILLSSVTAWGNTRTGEGHVEICSPDVPWLGKSCTTTNFKLNAENPLNAIARANRAKEATR